ncbi:MAG: multiheme c-type cytochrome [Acidobacteriota bacterium]|nr:multiheme c-type cytochrome [Acidobacteriota bacterium]
MRAAHPHHVQILPALLLAIGVLALAAQAPAQTATQTPAQTASQPASQPEAVPGGYVGVAACASTVCHGSTVPRDAYPVLQNEYFTWQQKDFHAQAYNVLLGERSRIIASNLGLVAAHEAGQCLDCHALTPPPERVAGRLEIEDGVTCESCHGAAGGWLEGHRSDGWEYEDSVEAGMTDLRSLPVRAELCLGCHLGDVERTVDHRLIAAGHPALVFELDNFAAAMPPHWNPPAQRGEELAGARVWAQGQLFSFRSGLEQLARRAEAGPWPEFAEMRCDSCHHGLQEERWRRGVRRPVGLPRWSPARWAALRPLVSAAEPGRLAELDRRVAAVAAGVADLGTPRAQVARRARGLAEQLAAVAPRLEALRWDPQRVRSMLITVAATDGPANLSAGYDTEVQLFLAANTLTGELFRWNPELASNTALLGTLQGLDDALRDRSRYAPAKVEALRARLANQVRRLSP